MWAQTRGMTHDRPVGELLREWRRRRQVSQLDLAIQAEVSARHISFVETGRAVPSIAMVLHLADVLEVPPRERNRLLVAAGHAPVLRESPMDESDSVRARETVQQVLLAHEPYPALAVDRHWNLVLANSAVAMFLEGAAAELLRPPINMMRVGLRPDGLAPRLRNLDQVRSYLLSRLAHQAARSGDLFLHELYEELVVFGPEPGPPDPSEAALRILLDYQGTELCLVNTVATFGAAFDTALDELAVETYLPADLSTRRYFGARSGY
ncbi:putative transcriptional regulator [Nocardia asteroides NBRC 15531]|uniref:Transcriptional regulator n=2 Tax=Nocardia asteroides TaxID=1824 RepID=U5E6Q7_NOCAS|nr:putative transcriptional regulator [Nocardia asteroides NBRC 15531]